MMNPLILSSDSTDEYYFEEGCYILELSNSTQDPGLSIARARVLPNTSTKPHRLSQTIERYIILSGSGEVTLGKRPAQTVGVNDVVIIPEDCSQSIRNTGDNDLVFLVICTPRFIKENYHELQQE